MEKELMLKWIFIAGFIMLLNLSTNAAEYEHPLIAFCEHMGYNHSLDTNENRFVIEGNCFFPDGTSCKLSEFYYDKCGVDYQKDINCRKKGQVVFEQFEKCCEGLYASECGYVLCQPTCESKLLDWLYPQDEEVTLPVAYCHHMDYIVKMDSELNRPMCVFDDGSYCTTDSFYEGECGKDKVKQLRERKEGEYVFTEFERCEDDLIPSEPKYLLEQPHCKYPSVFRKFWTKLKSLSIITRIDIANVPFCKDINVTGTDCHYIGDIFDKGVYNYSDGICKQYEPNPVIEHPKIGICFSTLEEEKPVNTINISKLNITWAINDLRPSNKQIPADYIQITIYETNCQCMDRISWCDNWDCDCDDYYCYNQSKIIWVPKNNCEMPIHCYTA